MDYKSEYHAKSEGAQAYPGEQKITKVNNLD